jgi:hypothetical protein
MVIDSLTSTFSGWLHSHGEARMVDSGEERFTALGH